MPAVSVSSRTLMVMRLVLLLLLLKKRKQIRARRRPRRWWVRPVFLARRQEGLYHTAATFSIVLLAVADSECKFVIIDVGAEGRQAMEAPSRTLTLAVPSSKVA
ncbi:hypothetical protein HPB50_029369 [Hyalomma asiaticum]|nr:hypothetical protein HPB50_029369 [Hyalomma asiaticum]